MATSIYKSGFTELVDGTEIYMTPLKIKYLRHFLQEFEKIKDCQNDIESLEVLAKCATVAMKQYYPSIKTVEQLEDSVDLSTIYTILEYAADIVFNRKDEQEPVKESVKKKSGSWEDLDLAALESEVFMLGIWKDYEELETSLSLPELTAILEQKREAEYEDKKFMAALQGVDLDQQSGKQNAWEEMKARVFSGGATNDPNDITAFQGANAQQAGFGIGMGLSYEKV
jgi:hypothetical protein